MLCIWCAFVGSKLIFQCGKIFWFQGISTSVFYINFLSSSSSEKFILCLSLQNLNSKKKLPSFLTNLSFFLMSDNISTYCNNYALDSISSKSLSPVKQLTGWLILTQFSGHLSINLAQILQKHLSCMLIIKVLHFCYYPHLLLAPPPHFCCSYNLTEKSKS